MVKGRRLLRVLRAEQEPKLTQAQLSVRAERLLPNGKTMSRSRYAQIEAGEGSEPSPAERAAVAAALGVKVSDIQWPELARVARSA
jgi:transcriptional regulator with XRE-family HTH domain